MRSRSPATTSSRTSPAASGHPRSPPRSIRSVRSRRQFPRIAPRAPASRPARAFARPAALAWYGPRPRNGDQRATMATDLYDIESLLNEEERLARDSVRSMVDAKILPVIGKHFEEGTFPMELIPEFGKLG